MPKKERNGNGHFCSFCGRGEQEVSFLIPTMDGAGAICNFCVEQAHAVVQQN